MNFQLENRDNGCQIFHLIVIRSFYKDLRENELKQNKQKRNRMGKTYYILLFKSLLHLQYVIAYSKGSFVSKEWSPDHEVLNEQVIFLKNYFF